MTIKDQTIWDPFDKEHEVHKNEYVLKSRKMRFHHKFALAVIALGFSILFLLIIVELLGFYDVAPPWLSQVSVAAFLITGLSGAYFAITYKDDPDDKIRDQFGLLFHQIACSLGTTHRHFISPIQVGLDRVHKSQAGRVKEIEQKTKDRLSRNHLELIIPKSQIEALAQAVLNKKEKYPSFVISDPEAFRIHSNLEKFLGPSVAIPTAINPMISIWGQAGTKPFFMALEGFPHDLLRPDRTENKTLIQNSNHRVTIGFLLGFPIGRNVEIEALLTGDLKIIQGWNDEELESIHFNEMFKVNLMQGEKQKLYQALTPAAQLCLMELHKQYTAEAYISGERLYVRGLIGLALSGQVNDDMFQARTQHRLLETMLCSAISQSQKLTIYLK